MRFAARRSVLMEAFPFRAIEQSRAYDSIRILPVCVVLDSVRSLYNVGSFFRTCDAAGVDRLYLTGITGRPPHRGIAKTALGAEDAVAWEHHDDADPLLGRLRASGRQIAAVETSSHAVDLYDWEPAFPVCLLFGNEVDGLAPALVERADIHVRIPSLGVKQSLNVATAGGVVLYELLRKYRRQWEHGRSGDKVAVEPSG